MKTRLDLMKAFLSDIEDLKHKNEVAKAILTKLREIIYETDNVLTDCILRDEYKKHCVAFGLIPSRSLLFSTRLATNLRHISTRMESIEKSLGSFLRASDSLEAPFCKG
ncbi:hypothetical protein FEM48_Zijuj01G0081600 [Ziziphus jujuba var. spinosa]|uniref:Disease resistance N-terminal domain-containing protein n=1 Tax=Ziziphus jujuba var. spinosa TaxID=714518 RepID=A0A978W042_ZIZJJ|nr:hypothetical protein FEM48_Zijuj01G0081600 [Ziziphus jujuba var. spinosa]